MCGSATSRSNRHLALLGLMVLAILALAYPVRASQWPSWRYDNNNSGATELELAPGQSPGSWTFRPGTHVWAYRPGMSVWSSPALGQVDGRAVLAIGSYDRNIYLLDACSGEKIWRHTTGNGVYSGPIIWRDNESVWVFASSSDRLVYGLDGRTGARRWSRALAGYQPTTGGSILSSPALGWIDGRAVLFVGHWVWDKSLANSTQEGGLSALDARTGQLVWQKDLLDNRVSTPVFGQVDGRAMVFVASQDGNLRALDAQDGSQIWYHRETEPIMASPLLVSGPDGARLYLGSHFGKMRCLDAGTGKEIWSFKTGNWITGSAMFWPSAQGDLVLFGSYDQHIYALDALYGHKVWRRQIAGPIFGSPALIRRQKDPLALFAAWDHQLHGLTLNDGTVLFSVFTGAPLWDAIVLGESNWASPAVARLGQSWILFHGSYDGHLYAIPLSQALLSGGSPPWTTWHFWLTMALSMALVTGLALGLTRRRRRSLSV